MKSVNYKYMAGSLHNQQWFWGLKDVSINHPGSIRQNIMLVALWWMYDPEVSELSQPLLQQFKPSVSQVSKLNGHETKLWQE